MPATPANSVSNARPRDYFTWCLAFCFAGLALAVSAQSPPSGPNPDPNAPITVPPDLQVQPEPAVQAQPAAENWDRISGIQKVPEDEWARHFRVGAIVGLNISATFNLKNNLSLSSKDAAAGNYDDGYVRSSGDGPFTSDWGYDQASQYDTAQHRLFLRKATSFTPDNSVSTEESGEIFPGFELAYGGKLWAWGNARIGWEFGFGLLPIDITGNLSSKGDVNQDVYAFDISGIDTWVGPQSGYHNGPGGSVTIPSAPVGSPTPDTVSGSITGKRTLDVILYTFRLGPTFYWNFNDYLDLTIGAGPALGLVSGHLDYDETITINGIANPPNRGQVDGTDVVYGGYANAMITYHVEDHGDLYVGVQYMPLGEATISGGGREGRLNLDGQVYITAGINWPF